MDWATKKSILFGAAQGLNYIHTFPARPALVHGNVKPSNILLDERGAACVSEWGLTRYAASVQHSAPQPPELFLDRATAAVSSLGGWRGYAAPELTASGARATQESDVYSFGMVLLEMVGGRKNLRASVERESEVYFPDWVHSHLKQFGSLQSFDLGLDEPEEITKKMATIGLWCIQISPASRPTMSKVLEMFERSVDELKIPPKHFIYSPIQ